MKLSKASVIAALALAGLVAGSGVAFAQNTTGDNKPAATTPQRGQRPDQLKQMTELLKLTDKQQADLKPVIKEQTDKLREIRAKTDLSQEDRRAEQKKVRDAANEKIKKILTTEQNEKWVKWQKDNPPRRRQPATQQ
jgi:Spy/CpxP family protein refolding chaperone